MAAQYSMPIQATKSASCSYWSMHFVQTLRKQPVLCSYICLLLVFVI